MANCYLCGNESQLQTDSDRDVDSVHCVRCGFYRVSDEVRMRFRSTPPLLSDIDKIRLSGVIRERTPCGNREPTELLTTTIEPLLSQAPEPFDIAAKARKLLAYFARKTEHAGQFIEYDTKTDGSLTYSAPGIEGDGEFEYVINYLRDVGWIVRGDMAAFINASLTPKGWEENHSVKRIDSTNAFVAMSFEREMDDAFDKGIYPAIDSCGYKPIIINQEQFIGGIVDKIKAEINESLFAICDLTNNCDGVYFEAGYAMGRGIPVIWTCREDAVEKIHFDAKHFNQIRWKAPEDLSKALAMRILATIGRGPLTPGE